MNKRCTTWSGKIRYIVDHALRRKAIIQYSNIMLLDTVDSFLNANTL